MENSGDRWDTANKELGWSLEEIKQEFNEFFETYDASLITDIEHEDRDKFDVELRQTLSLYDLGVQSGKVSAAEAYSDNEETRF